MRYLIALLCLSSVSLTASAQSLSGDDVKTQFIADWNRAKSYTDKYLSAMPADKYSFKAVDSTRSYAQQMLHLASANYFLVSTALGEKPQAAVFGAEERSSAQSADSVQYYVNASYDFVINELQALDPSTLGAKVKLRTFEATRFALLEKAFEHQTHHRGQTTIYIRLLGIRPPNEQLF
ncbi:DinB family protein [Dinghuibacter silviterrae]|uniref:Putative damage-inducible protein DinB n=1 Tax=Dinghuibacter silviterrae TaxID=1539049 RepID=A0A4R8DXT7_9BACT|nr:DinB family protein [Dinghuibacter silviterrae]TDX02031.1 putative damage-inducible protein DinB [Dinghuibacter silviterrae]